jgi:uncharacterized protein YdeI (YjbR/CyaY-like superfamily)
MKIGETLYVIKRKDWRRWLSKNYNKKKEIWLVYYKKSSGKPRIAYDEAVEEALCFGWIDSIVKRIDSEKHSQRFSPRRKGSQLSEINHERVKKLIKQGKMTEAGLQAISFTKRELKIKPDVLKKMKENKEVWNNFRKFPDSYQRVRIAYIESQRKHSKQAFEKSLNNFIKLTKRNKMFGSWKG